jgi:hypothetical protein
VRRLRHDERVFIASEEGVVVVLDAGEKLNILAKNKLDGTILATPALVDSNIYVRTENHLYADEAAVFVADVRRTDTPMLAM